uniref:Transposase (Putative), gypsy type n=1 Tax=Tanacetum cinerariifolium TaxID=118510 RepID=A0A6L2NGN3_TANCI|nr:hypothetical protein [Tanacetum cinerariifolium]
MGRDTIQLEDVVSTISHEYLLEFTLEYGIPESLHPELPGPEEPMSFRRAESVFTPRWMSFSKRPGKNTPQCYTKPLDSLKNWNNRFFWVDERIFPTIVEWRTNALKDKMPSADSYSAADVTILNTRRTLIQKQPEALLCLVGLSRGYFLGDDVYPTFLYDDDRVLDIVPLLTATASRVIDMEETAVASGSLGTPSTLKKSPLDFANEDPPQMITKRGGTEQVQDELVQGIPHVENATMTEDEAEVNAPPKVLRKDHAAFRPAQSTLGGKSLAPMGLDVGSTVFTPATQDAPTTVSDPNPLSYTKPQPHFERDITESFRKTATEIPSENVATTKVQGMFSAESHESGKSTSFLFEDGSPGGIYQLGWGMTNNCRLDTLNACQDMVDHIVPPGYFSKLRHLPNTDFLSEYNINLARQVAIGSQLRLRFEQEVRLLKKAKAKIARRDQRIQAREEETKNLETLLEAEVDMKKAAKANNAELAKELESLSVQFSDLRVSNIQLSQQVSNLQAQVSGGEKIKAAFKEFKRYEDDRVEQRCGEMDARLDKLSVDFDEELYPHMLTGIAGRRWGMSEGLKHDIEHERAGRDLAAIEAYDPEADSKYVKALQDLKDLRCPQCIRDLRPSSSQLKIPIYHEVCDLEDPWAFKEEVLLEDAIAANKSWAKKKKKCRVVCRTHGVGFAHHARSDGIPVSVLTVAPRGLVILLADAATHTEVADKEDEPYPRLQ